MKKLRYKQISKLIKWKDKKLKIKAFAVGVHWLACHKQHGGNERDGERDEE